MASVSSIWSSSICIPFVKAAAQPGDALRGARRGDRHRRTVARARGRQELPRRAGRRRSGRLPAPARGARRRRRAWRSGASWHARRSRTPRPTTRRSRRRWRPSTSSAIGSSGAWTASRRRWPITWTCRSTRSATSATARTLISGRPGIATLPGGAAAGLGEAAILQGKELSYTNLLDLDAAARLVLEFDEPAAAVIKHTNPCGAATGASPAGGVSASARSRQPRGLWRNRRAESARSMSATADSIVSTFIEAVIAPGRRRRRARRSSRAKPVCAS